MVLADYVDRRFQVWEHTVGHASLLLRSPKTSAHSMNVDLAFVGVTYLALPQVLDGVIVERAEERDRESVIAATGAFDPERTFVVITGGRRHFVVAVGWSVTEHQADIFDSPFADGQVLAGRAEVQAAVAELQEDLAQGVEWENADPERYWEAFSALLSSIENTYANTGRPLPTSPWTLVAATLLGAREYE